MGPSSFRERETSEKFKMKIYVSIENRTNGPSLFQNNEAFNMTYLPSNILLFQRNGTVSNIELFLVAMFWHVSEGIPHM